MTKPRVIYWNNIAAPYMVERFSAVAERGNLEFEAWFNDLTAADRGWRLDEESWPFRSRTLCSRPSWCEFGGTQSTASFSSFRRPDQSLCGAVIRGGLACRAAQGNAHRVLVPSHLRLLGEA